MSVQLLFKVIDYFYRILAFFSSLKICNKVFPEVNYSLENIIFLSIFQILCCFFIIQLLTYITVLSFKLFDYSFTIFEKKKEEPVLSNFDSWFAEGV